MIVEEFKPEKKIPTPFSAIVSLSATGKAVSPPSVGS